MSKQGQVFRRALVAVTANVKSFVKTFYCSKPIATLLAIVFLAIVVPPLLSACSVGMAMSGEDDPNVAVIRIGADRLDVERELGAPQNAKLLDDGRLEGVYYYELGNEPSAGRAVMHGALDILTIGLWEVVGTPVEAGQGTDYEMTIVYDLESRVQSINTVKLLKNENGEVIRRVVEEESSGTSAGQ